MNKDYQTRPRTSDILGFPFIQDWAKELNIRHPQLQKHHRPQGPSVQEFLAATERSITSTLKITIQKLGDESGRSLRVRPPKSPLNPRKQNSLRVPGESSKMRVGYQSHNTNTLTRDSTEELSNTRTLTATSSFVQKPISVRSP